MVFLVVLFEDSYVFEYIVDCDVCCIFIFGFFGLVGIVIVILDKVVFVIDG